MVGFGSLLSSEIVVLVHYLLLDIRVVTTDRVSLDVFIGFPNRGGHAVKRAVHSPHEDID